MCIRDRDTTEVLADDEPLYNNASPAFLTVYNSNNTGTGEEAGINLVPAGNANGAISIYGKKTGSYAGDLIFRFRSGASTSAERLRITSAGLVGINEASPSGAQLVVKNSDDSNLNAITILNDNGNMSSSLSQDSTGAGSYLQKDNAGNIKTFIRSYNTSYFLGGDVGIGEDTPGAKLAIYDSDGHNIYLRNSWSGEAGIGFGGGTNVNLSLIHI